MDVTNKVLDDRRNIPKDLMFAIKFSTAVNAVASITYMFLAILSIIFYFSCGTGITEAPSKQLWSIIYRVYLQDAHCHDNSFIQLIPSGLTKANTVFVLNTVLLSFTVVNVITSVALFFKVHSADPWKHLKVFVYVYLCAWAGTLVIDLTLGTHFGIDITHLANLMDESESYDFFKETLRVGAFYLMSIALKGYVIHVINLVVIAVMITLLYQHQRDLTKRLHSMHSQRVLDAFEGYGASILDNETLPPQGNLNNTRADFYRQASSPQTRVNSPMHPNSRYVRDRPFSYLEERPSTKPAMVQYMNKKPHMPPPPPLPVPDYSPHSRVKSLHKTF